MPFSSSNTGSTDLRLTEVQQPNTAATLSFCSSSRAFSANSGQFDAGSTTTASSFLPRRPPFLFCCSMSISMTSFRVVSLIAMVPDSEWRIPTLIVSLCANALVAAPAIRPAATRPVRIIDPNFIPLSPFFDGFGPSELGEAKAVPIHRPDVEFTLLSYEDIGATGQNEASKGPQSQVADKAAYNPAESRADPQQKGRGRQKAQHILASICSRGLECVHVAMEDSEHSHDTHGCGGSHSNCNQDKAAQQKHRG